MRITKNQLKKIIREERMKLNPTLMTESNEYFDEQFEKAAEGGDYSKYEVYDEEFDQISDEEQVAMFAAKCKEDKEACMKVAISMFKKQCQASDGESTCIAMFKALLAEN